ncbi:MAG: Uma2 family endonuclease [Acidobacteriota bacterium]
MSAHAQREKLKTRTSSKPTAPKAVVPEQSMVRRWRFSVADFNAMIEAGVLKEDDRVELIEGEIVEMSPIGTAHSSCVKRLNALLAQRIAQHAILSVQDPVQASGFSQPQPDIALLKYRADFYAARHPLPKDILLVIEVADSTVVYDREVKMPLYARAKIAQAVLIDLSSQVIEVYSRPVKGKYTRVQTLKRGDALTIHKLPDVELKVGEILG